MGMATAKAATKTLTSNRVSSTEKRLESGTTATLRYIHMQEK
jgi:hypothetical protein